MEELDRMILEVQQQRADFRDRADRCQGLYDREGYRIDAAACAIRERALLDARRAVSPQILTEKDNHHG